MNRKHKPSRDLEAIVKKFAHSGVKLLISKKPKGIGFVGEVSKQAAGAPKPSNESTEPKPPAS